jgi:hypothetical protein
VRIGVKVEREVGAKVGIEVDAEVRMVTIKEIGFEVGVNSFGKS